MFSAGANPRLHYAKTGREFSTGFVFISFQYKFILKKSFYSSL